MREERAKLSRHNDIAKAMDYVLKRWNAFTRFVDDGRICLTNNAAERALRGIALGRKSWLFAGFFPDYSALSGTFCEATCRPARSSKRAIAHTSRTVRTLRRLPTRTNYPIGGLQRDAFHRATARQSGSSQRQNAPNVTGCRLPMSSLRCSWELGEVT